MQRQRTARKKETPRHCEAWPGRRLV